MDITGTIITVLPAQTGTSSRTGNSWMRQSYVFEVPGQWPRHMAFTIFGEDRIKQFNLHQGEQNITVQFDIDAHEYQGRWFNEIRAYNIIRPYTGKMLPSKVNSCQPEQQPTQGERFTPQEKPDELPF